MLGQRIETFVNGAAKLLAERHIQSPHIEFQVRKLKDRWNLLNEQVEETRRLIDLSIQYFELVEEVRFSDTLTDFKLRKVLYGGVSNESGFLLEIC